MIDQKDTQKINKTGSFALLIGIVALAFSLYGIFSGLESEDPAGAFCWLIGLSFGFL